MGKILGRLRGIYDTAPNTTVIYSFAVIIVGGVAGVLIDRFLPFNFWWNALRALISIPLAVAFFVVGYMQALNMHERKVETVPGWVSFRDRFSPSWRRRFSAIVGAVLVVVAYASSQTPFYTIVTAGILAAIFALFAFMRLTGEEKRREAYELPDVRDINYDERLGELKEERRKIEEKAQAEKKARRLKILTLGAYEEESSEEIEDNTKKGKNLDK